VVENWALKPNWVYEMILTMVAIRRSLFKRIVSNIFDMVGRRLIGLYDAGYFRWFVWFENKNYDSVSRL